MSRTIARVLRPALRHRPDAPAVVARSGTLTYADLDRAASAAAGAMWHLGVRPGDRVAACLPNDLDVVVAFHGAQRIGAIWVGINEAFTRDEQQALADLAAPSLILAGPRSQARGGVVLETGEWARLALDAPAPPAVETDQDAPAGIAFTSGTTGVPKGVVHSQRNMLLPGEVLVRTRGWGPGLRKGDCLPLTLLNMLILTTLLVAQAEGCCVLMDRRDVPGVAEWIGRERVTVWNGVPAQLYDLARQPELDLSSLEEDLVRRRRLPGRAAAVVRGGPSGAGPRHVRPHRGADGGGHRPGRRPRPGPARPGGCCRTWTSRPTTRRAGGSRPGLRESCGSAPPARENGRARGRRRWGSGATAR